MGKEQRVMCPHSCVPGLSAWLRVGWGGCLCTHALEAHAGVPFRCTVTALDVRHEA